MSRSAPAPGPPEPDRGARGRAAALARGPWGPVLVAALVGLAYLAVDPPTADLAAQEYRVEIARRGAWLWDGGWFGGHHLPSYSVLFPALGVLVGTGVAGVLFATLGAWAFQRVAVRVWPAGAAAAASCWFAAASGAMLFTGRLTFSSGVALGAVTVLLAARAAEAERREGSAAGLGEVPALGRGRAASAARLGAVALGGVATALASPVAALFLGMLGVAWAVERLRARGADRTTTTGPDGALHVATRFTGPAVPRRLVLPVVLAAAPVLAAGVLAVLFPNGGDQPFVAWEALMAIVALALCVAVLPREERLLRTAAALYVLAVAASALVSSPMGSNAPRLGTLLAAPVVVGALLARRGRGRDGGTHARGTDPAGPPRPPAARRATPLAVAAVLALLAWQLYSPVQQSARALSDPSANAGYYAPVRRAILARTGGAPVRVEVPPTAARGEARWLSPGVPLARGWARQLDRDRNALFYDGRPLTAARYRAWLDREAVAWVALPDAKPDVASRAEVRLLRSGAVPGLERAWGDGHWTLWRVRGATPLATGARVVRETPGTIVLDVPRPGSVTLRFRWSRYLEVRSGPACAPVRDGNMTRLRAVGRGTVSVATGLPGPWRKGSPPACGE